MKKALQLTFIAAAALMMIVLFDACTKKNNVPQVNAVMVTPNVVDAGGTATINVTATDLDNDPLTYGYTVTGGAITGSGPAVQWTAPTQQGAHSVTVTVSDGRGGQAIGNGALTVNAVSTITRVKGSCKFPAGTSGDLSNSKVSLYTTLDNWNNNQPVVHGAVTGSGSSVTFDLTNVVPGNYYLDIWKDNDNNGFWSVGDFVGWYGSGGLGSPALTEFQLRDGQTFSVDINMFIL